jgi:hypothetical protein
MYEKKLLLYSLPWRERVRVRGIVSGFTLTLFLSRQGRGIIGLKAYLHPQNKNESVTDVLD